MVADDPALSTAAIAALRGAEQIAVALPALYEFVWVMRRVDAFPVAEITAAIRALMEAGGDFADAVIAHEGQWLGGEMFLSFDRQAVALLQQQGIAAELLR